MDIYHEYKEKLNKRKNELKGSIIDKCIDDSLMVISKGDDEYKLLEKDKSIIKELNSLGLSIIKIKRKWLYQYSKPLDDLNHSIVVYIDKVGINRKEVLRKHKILEEFKAYESK